MGTNTPSFSEFHPPTLHEPLVVTLHELLMVQRNILSKPALDSHKALPKVMGW